MIQPKILKVVKGWLINTEGLITATLVEGQFTVKSNGNRLRGKAMVMDQDV